MRATPRSDARRSSPPRRGVATAELAVVLSTLIFICLATCDYARSMYAAVTVANCARNGALYACDAGFAAGTPYTSTQQAALADASGLTPAPTVSSATGLDSTGNRYVDVTVSYNFQTTVNYPDIPNVVTITRTVRMAIAPP
jgi:Flp pilus assembly protein TadG